MTNDLQRAELIRTLTANGIQQIGRMAGWLMTWIGPLPGTVPGRNLRNG